MVAAAMVLSLGSAGQSNTSAHTAGNPVPQRSRIHPTFYKDVLPILQDHCQICHREGEIAPTPFVNYEQTRPWAARPRVRRRMRLPHAIGPRVGTSRSRTRLCKCRSRWAFRQPAKSSTRTKSRLQGSPGQMGANVGDSAIEPRARTPRGGLHPAADLEVVARCARGCALHAVELCRCGGARGGPRDHE